MKKSGIAIVAILAFGIGAGLSWITARVQPVQLEVGTWLGDQARTLPDFELIDQNGKIFARDDLQGKWQLLFFGYTHCPDICPMSLQTLADSVKAIDDPDVSDTLQVIFVSVDPQRDNPQRLKRYTEYFNPDFVAATGTVTDLNRLTRSLGMTYAVNQTDSHQDNYEVSHSAAFVLLNPEVKFAGIFGPPHDSQAIARDLIKVIEHN